MSVKKYVPSFVYEESEILDAVLEAVETEFQNFQSYIEQEILKWYIDTATGEALDRIGLLAGVKRAGRGDEEYRAAIKSQILATAGTEEVLLTIAKDLSDETAEVSDYGPGQVEIKVNAEAVGGKAGQAILKESINRAKVAGVQAIHHWRIFENLKDTLQVQESVSIPHEETVEGGVAASDDLAVSESITLTEHTLPFRWGSFEWSFAEWS